MYISLKVKKSALFSALISYIDPYAWLLVKAQTTTCLEREQKTQLHLQQIQLTKFLCLNAEFWPYFHKNKKLESHNDDIVCVILSLLERLGE
jgi:positive regulator of sigma E activity